MKKQTARRLTITLVVSYAILLCSGIFLWLMLRVKTTDSVIVSEVATSDTITLQENEKPTPETVPESQENLEATIDEEDCSDVEETNEIRMVFTGDVYIGNYVSNVYESVGVLGVVADSLADRMRTADLAMVNQEFAFSTRGVPMKDKQYTFRVDPKKVSLLTELGVDVVSLANNHTLDYGVEALCDTLETLKKSEITYVGAGETLSEAKTTRYVQIHDQTIALLSASRVIPVSEWGATATRPGMFTTYDPTALMEEIKTARQNADVVIVYVHWGLEHKEYPESYQRTMGKQFIDAGADVVIGSHPHILQGFEYYNGKLIAYSLGNFIFSETIQKTALFEVWLDADNELHYSIVPCTTTKGQTREMEDETMRKELYEDLSRRSEGVIINETGEILPQS